MKAENLNMEEITELRRKALAASLRTISTEELKGLGERLFPLANDPWREKFFEFLTENPTATYHHGTTHDEVQVIYCNAKEKGIWFKPGVGLGLLQPISLGRLKQIVEAR
jgi:hypothetical protein